MRHRTPHFSHVFGSDGCSVGNTVDPAEAYRRFRGRDASSEALMRKRGFSGAAGQGGGRK